MKKLIIIALLLLNSAMASEIQTGFMYGCSLGENVSSLANWSISWKNEDERANFFTLKTASDMTFNNSMISAFTEFDHTLDTSVPMYYVGGRYAYSARGEWTMLSRLGLANTKIGNKSQMDILVGWTFFAMRDYAVVVDTCTFDYYISLGGKSHWDFDIANFGLFF